VLLGIGFDEGRAIVSQHPFAVLKHGETRRTHKAVLSAGPLTGAAPWQIPAAPAGSGHKRSSKGKRKRSSGSGGEAVAE